MHQDIITAMITVIVHYDHCHQRNNKTTTIIAGNLNFKIWPMLLQNQVGDDSTYSTDGKDESAKKKVKICISINQKK